MGDAVAVDDVLVVIETDKVSVEVPASVAGTLAKQYAETNAVVEVGKPLVDINEGATGGKPAAAPAPAHKEASHAPAPAPASAGPKSTQKCRVWCLWVARLCPPVQRR